MITLPHLRSKKLWMGRLRATKQCEIETLLGTLIEPSIEMKKKIVLSGRKKKRH